MPKKNAVASDVEIFTVERPKGKSSKKGQIKLPKMSLTEAAPTLAELLKNASESDKGFHSIRGTLTLY